MSAMPTTEGRDRLSGTSEFFLMLWEKLAEGVYRVQVEAVKAVRIGRLRLEMIMLRRDRRSAVLRLGEAAHAAVHDGRVDDPVLVALAREVDDVDVALGARQDEAARIATLPDEEVLGRQPGREPQSAEAADPGKPLGPIPVTRRDPLDDTVDDDPGTSGRPLGGSSGAAPPREP